MASYNVRLECLPIADGITLDHSGGRTRKFLNICVCLTPLSVDEATEFKLPTLPEDIRRFFATHDLCVWQNTVRADREWKLLELGDLARSRAGLDDHEADAVWQSLMTDYDGNALFDALHAALRPPVADKEGRLKRHGDHGPSLDFRDITVPNVTKWYNDLADSRIKLLKESRDEMFKYVAAHSEGAVRMTTERLHKWLQNDRATREKLWGLRSIRYQSLVKNLRAGSLNKLHYRRHDEPKAANEEASFNREFQLHDSALFYEPPLPTTRQQSARKIAAEERLNLARGRYLGINAHPRLATLLGLSVNLLYPLDKFPQEDVGLLCAAFVDKQLPLKAKRAALPPPELLNSAAYRHVGLIDQVDDEDSFQPASRCECNVEPLRSAPPLYCGFVKLNEGSRYRLRACDVTLALRGEFAQVNNRDLAISEGSTADHSQDRFHAFTSPGIELVDTQAEEELRRLAHVGQRQWARQQGKAMETLYAEDLLVGYRVDIERTDSRTRTSVWASAVARAIEYGEGNTKVRDHGWNASSYRNRDDGSVRTAVRNVQGKDEKEKDGDKTIQYGRSEMFLWSGDSLGLPGHDDRADAESSERQPPPGEPTKADSDLNLAMEYAFAAKEGNLPVLRLGDSYRFVLRACFRHGGGPTFSRESAARARSRHDRFALGREGLDTVHAEGAPLSSGTAGMPFQTSEPVGAPVMAFRGEDPFLHHNCNRNGSSNDKTNHQQLEQVVLCTNADHEEVVRILLPPRIPAVAAEMQKQFDHSHELVPRGAFENLERNQRGDFPPAGGTPLTQVNSHHAVDDAPPPLGPVVRRGSAPRGAPPYYCDARARTVSIRLSRNGLPCDDLPAECLEVKFWLDGETPNSALPIAVECRLGPPDMRGARFVAPSASLPLHKVIRSTKYVVPMYVIAIEVGRGDEIQVDAWCHDISSTGLFRENRLLQSALQRWSLGYRDKTGDPISEDLANGFFTTFAMVRSDCACDQTRFRIVTPVRQPLAAPKFLPPSNTKDSFSVTRLHTHQAEETWSGIIKVLQTGEVPVDKHAAGGDVGFLAGRAIVRRRSTSSLKIQAAWREFDDELCLQAVEKSEPCDHLQPQQQLKNKKYLCWEYAPLFIVREFAPALPIDLPETIIDVLSKEKDNPKADKPQAPSDSAVPVSLIRGKLEQPEKPLKKPHAAPHDPPDDPKQLPWNIRFDLGKKAMRLGVRLVGVSRFKTYYGDPKPSQQATPQETCRSGGSTELAEFPLECLNGNLPERDQRVIWLPATERPPCPELAERRIELVNRRIEHLRSDSKIVIEHAWTFRIRLKRGTWFKSGEGELLGIVFMPQDLVEDEKAANAARRRAYGLSNGEFGRADQVRRLDRTLGNIGEAHRRLVTAWAVDPATHAGKMLPAISPSYFNPVKFDASGNVVQKGWVTKRPQVVLPFEIGDPAHEQNATVPAPVSVIGYEPELDPCSGERFVDLDIQSPDVDSPFVRLSLVRFQPHAIPSPDGNGDLCLSPQIVLDPLQLPATRRIEVEWTPQGLKVEITGPAYSRRTPVVPGVTKEPEMPDPQIAALAPFRHQTDVAWMRLRVMRRVGNGPDADKYVQFIDPTFGEMAREIPSIPNGHIGTWSLTFPLKPGKEKFRLYVEEFERHPAAPVTCDSHPPRFSDTPRAFKCDIDL